MPKETIRRLSEDALRLMVAGAHLAGGDPELRKNHAALDGLAKQLGDKAPVLGKLADATERVLSGKDPGELLSLAVNLSQVRAAHAEPAPAEGAAVPLPAALPLGTPCATRDLYDLHSALTESGSGRDEKIRNALVRSDIADLRLAESVLKALADPYLGERVEKDVLPRFGKALLGPLRRDFDVKGVAADARRLRVLVTLEPGTAGDLLKRALTDGGAPVREAGFRLLAEQFPGQADFEALVLEGARKEKASNVRAAAVRALAHYPSDSTLQTLIDMLGHNDLGDPAAEALRRLKHPDLVPRLLKDLDLELDARAKKRPAKGNAKDPRASTLLYILSGFKHPEVIRRGLSLLEELGAPAAEAALHSDDPAVLAKVADRILSNDVDVYGPAVRAIGRLGEAEAFRRLTAVYTAKDRSSETGEQRIQAATDAIASSKDPRWDDFLMDLVQTDVGLTTGTKLRSLLGGAKPKPGKATALAIAAIGRRGNRAHVKPLLKALASDSPPQIKVSIVEALNELGDRSAIDPLLAVGLEAKDHRLGWPVNQAVLALAEPATVGKVRKMVASMKEGSSARGYFENLLQLLERKFPGQ